MIDWSALPQALHLRDVRIERGFSGERQANNRDQIPLTIYLQLKQTGRLDGWNPAPYHDPCKSRNLIHMFRKSHMGRRPEAAGNRFMSHPNPGGEQQTGAVIGHVKRAPQPDGYLKIYFNVSAPKFRWRNLCDCHDLSDADPMLKGAVVCFQANGTHTIVNSLDHFDDHLSSMIWILRRKQAQLSRLHRAGVSMANVMGQPRNSIIRGLRSTTRG